MMVRMKRSFSRPLFERKLSPDPPQAADNPVPLAWRRTKTIRPREKNIWRAVTKSFILRTYSSIQENKLIKRLSINELMMRTQKKPRSVLGMEKP